MKANKSIIIIFLAILYDLLYYCKALTIIQIIES